MTTCQQKNNNNTNRNTNMKNMNCNVGPIQRQGLPSHFTTDSKFGGPTKEDRNRTQNCVGFRNKTAAFDDPCAVSVKSRQSHDTGKYQVTNFFRPCGVPIMTDCLIDQVQNYPQVWGNVDQCNVDNDTVFRYAPLTNMKYRQQLFSRPYASQGYHGAGANNTDQKDLESALLQGNTTSHFKPCENSSEVYIDRYEYLPEYGNPQKVEHCVENWTRGGLLSRELVRRLTYQDFCNSMNRSPSY